MNTFFPRLTAAALVGAALLSGRATLRAQAPAEPRPIPADDITVQTRGPVHEAFAQPLDPSGKPGPVIAKQPPKPVVEVPPDQKPEGENVQWIPGYWAWDDEAKDYLWVSGFWRQPPPGRTWVPGHWNAVAGGWQWGPGFWADASQPAVQYVDPPPTSLENGPSSPAPDADSYYVPGNWLFRDPDWVWQPGFWAQGQPGYVYTPAQYVPTPSGCAYVSGYWDYPVEARGLLFSPVTFARPFWNTPGWCYQPDYTVGVGGLLGSLFVRPGRGYYYGDYYGDSYLTRGYSPWFAYGRRSYDPLFSYYRWTNRGNPGWYRGLSTLYQDRLAGRLPLPPRTFAAQNAFLRQTSNRERVTNYFDNRSVTVGRNLRLNATNAFQMARPLSQVRNDMRLTRVDVTQRATQRNLTQQFDRLSVERRRLEAVTRSDSVRRPVLPLRGGSVARVPGTIPAAPRPLPRGPLASPGRPAVGTPVAPVPSAAHRPVTPALPNPGRVTPPVHVQPSPAHLNPSHAAAPLSRVTPPSVQRPIQAAPSHGVPAPSVTPRPAPPNPGRVMSPVHAQPSPARPNPAHAVTPPSRVTPPSVQRPIQAAPSRAVPSYSVTPRPAPAHIAPVAPRPTVAARAPAPPRAISPPRPAPAAHRTPTPPSRGGGSNRPAAAASRGGHR